MNKRSYHAQVIAVPRTDGDLAIVCAFPEASSPYLKEDILRVVQRSPDCKDAILMDYDFDIVNVLDMKEGEQE